MSRKSAELTRRLTADRAEARARFLTTATSEAVLADTIKSHPLMTMAAGVAAGYLVARRGKGLPLVVALARLWMSVMRRS